MRKLYSFETRIGTFYIAERGQRYFPMFGDKFIDSFHTPQMAAYQLANGYTFSLVSDKDIPEIGIPDDLSEWELMTLVYRA